MKTISLLFCRVDYEHGNFVVTHFPDGTSCGALPHETEAYRALTKRCGYGDDIWHYCIEHEVAHSFVAQELYRGVSRVLWGMAHDQVAAKLDILHEEELTISLQAFTRAHLLPGSSAPGFSWFTLREKFLRLLE